LRAGKTAAVGTRRDAEVTNKNLRKVGLKVTQPRMRILELLETNKTRHLTADDIYRELVGSGEEIGLATVYRVLSQFEAAGLVVKHNFESGQAFFELDSGEHHDHMVCVETGKVIEFVSEDIEVLQKKIAAAHGYEIEDHNLVIYVRPKAR
jgi:Fur family ferric uptake transcriptional regulator